jgi:hypothetical protein
MKFTRRKLAHMLTVSAALPMAVRAQQPAGGSAGSDTATKPDAAVSAAREEFRGAARALAAVKLARSVEPATRFEA